MNELRIPEIDPDDATETAALKYAAGGWYVGPGHPDDRKNPGRILGKGWQARTSRDTETIVSWFAGRDWLLYLHCGRSGAWVADVDRPDLMPDVLRDAIERQRPPHQSSRPDQPGRGHCVFRQPADRMIGNGTGALGKGWGEGRGRNGVIFVAPSRHQHEDDGARYQWLRTGVVPDMTPELAAALPTAGDSADAATDERVRKFIAEHTGDHRPALAKGVLSTFYAAIGRGGSRHDALRDAACQAARESLVGMYPAKAVFDELTTAFEAVMTKRGADGAD